MNRRARTQKNNSTESQAVRDRILPWQIGMICIVAFLSPMVSGKLLPIPDQFIQGLIFIGTLLFLVRAIKNGSIDLPSRLIVIITASISVLLILSAIGTESMHLTLGQLANYGSYLLIFLMVAGMGRCRRAVYGMLASLIVAAILVSAVGIREYIFSGQEKWRVFATFFNPDFLAGFMAVMLPLALAWYLSRTSKGVTLIAGFAVLGISANILLSGSRFGAVAAVGGVLVFLLLALYARQIGKSQTVRGLILLVPIILVFLRLGSPLTNRVATVGAESHSGNFRVYTWKGAARMAEANPINGTGLGTFEIAYPRYALVGYTKLAHNSYLQIAAEAGTPAALALIALIIYCPLTALMSLSRRRAIGVSVDNVNITGDDFAWTPDTGLIICGLIGAAAASFARNLVDSDLYVTAIGIEFFLIIGSLVALAKPENEWKISSARKWVWTGIAFLILCISSQISVLCGSYYESLENYAWTNDGPAGAIGVLNRARKCDPLNADYHRNLAQAYHYLLTCTNDKSYIGSAEGEFKKAIRLEPNNAKNYYRRARFYEGLGRNEDAMNDFQTAVKYAPNSGDPLFALANRLEAMGRHEEALSVWHDIIGMENSPIGQVRAVPEVVEPQYIFAHYACGMEYDRRGEKNRAKKEYQAALEQSDRYLDSMEKMRRVMEASGHKTDAMESQVKKLRDKLNLLLGSENQSGG